MSASALINGNAAESEEITVVHVTVAYEDTPTGVRAVRSLDLFPLRAPGKRIFTRKLWRWDLLKDRLLMEQAARDAGDADIVVLSSHGREELPDSIKVWLDHWLRHQWDNGRLLVLLMDPDLASRQHQSPVLSWVRQIVETTSVDLLYGFSDPPACCALKHPPRGASSSARFE